MTDATTTGSASVHVLHEGYVRDDPAGDRVGSSVTLILDAGRVIVVDPGMVPDRDALLAALAAHGPAPGDVTDIVFSHHHPDHTLNAALFERARFHDFWAIYQDDTWTERPADGFQLSPSVTLMATPGHTAQDITTLAVADGGLVACTHLWWSSEGPAVDPLAEDQQELERSRARLLALGPALIVPGHGAPFEVGRL